MKIVYKLSVKEAFAARRAAETRYTVVTIPFAFELIVVSKLFVCNTLALINMNSHRGTHFVQCPAAHR